MLGMGQCGAAPQSLPDTHGTVHGNTLVYDPLNASGLGA